MRRILVSFFASTPSLITDKVTGELTPCQTQAIRHTLILVFCPMLKSVRRYSSGAARRIHRRLHRPGLLPQKHPATADGANAAHRLAIINHFLFLASARLFVLVRSIVYRLIQLST